MKDTLKGLEALKSKKWWNAALTRLLKTGAQSALGTLAVTTIYDIDWKATIGIVAAAMLISLLTSIAGIPEVEAEK
jgi:hypothetical protein